MKATCIITNYNYSKYVMEAVESALHQTTPFAEIIVVDDCSTDDSAHVLTDAYENHDRVRLVLKEKNGGMMSSFNAAYAHATGDVVFFLDADDMYVETYLEEALRRYTEMSCDFLFCARQEFGYSSRVHRRYPTDRNLGCSAAATFYTGVWIGSYTSTLSLRKSILDCFMPVPFEEDWRQRADDCLIWAASLAGARKYYIAEPLVKYRIHSHNDSHNRLKLMQDPTYLYGRELVRKRLYSYVLGRMSYTGDLIDLAVLEFNTIPHPDCREVKMYLRLIADYAPGLRQKFKQAKSVVKRYLKSLK